MLTLYILQVGMYKYTVDCISVSLSIYIRYAICLPMLNLFMHTLVWRHYKEGHYYLFILPTFLHFAANLHTQL